MLTLTLPWPPSLNRYYRHVGSRVLISRDGRAYRGLVAACVQEAHGAYSAIQGRLAVCIQARPPDRRLRDLDNVNKALLDALTHARVWQDDSQIDDLRVQRCAPMSGGRVVVSIAEIVREAAA